jgi:TonB family protein
MGVSPVIEIPGYTVLRLLGHGGMATVYLALQQSLKREVALKILSPALAQDAIATERFLREARVSAKLHHPHIVAIYDVGLHDGVPFMSIAYEPGGTVARKTQARDDPKIALRIIRDIASALDYAHSQGVIHRDVKPENILLRNDGTCVLSDFGIAHAVESQTGLTREGTSVGTPHYMSPEQLRGEHVDGRTDLYSLGVVFYQLLTGELPYQGTDGWAIGMQHLSSPIPQLPPHLAHLQTFLDAMLAKDPGRRLQTGSEVVQWVDARLSGQTAAMTVAMPTPMPMQGSATPGGRASAASIAILPFADMSQGKDQEYLADGLSEELLNLLSKVQGLFVASRSSAFNFKGKGAKLVDIGRELKVATVLEGSVRKFGERVRISVQLINVEDGFQRWSETYDRQLTDVFAVQDEIAALVVAALKEQLLPKPAPAPPAVDPAIAREFKNGRELLLSGTRSDLLAAIAAFDKVLALDAQHAAAQGAKAEAHEAIARLDEEEAKAEAARAAQAREAAEKAAREVQEREAAEKAAREVQEREAAEKAAREAREREATEESAREAREREAAEKASAEARQREAAEKQAAEARAREAAEKAAAENRQREEQEKAAAEARQQQAAELSSAQAKQREAEERAAAEKRQQEAAERAAAEKRQREAAELAAAQAREREAAEREAAERAAAEARQREAAAVAATTTAEAPVTPVQAAPVVADSARDTAAEFASAFMSKKDPGGQGAPPRSPPPAAKPLITPLRGGIAAGVAVLALAAWLITGYFSQRNQEQCQALMLQAQSATDAGQFDKAASAATDAREVCQGNALVSLQGLDVRIQAGKAKNKACELAESQANDQLERGQPIQAKQTLDAASNNCAARPSFTDLAQRQSSAESDARTLVSRATSLTQAGALAEAQDLLDQALKLDANSEDAHKLVVTLAARRAKLPGASPAVPSTPTAATATAPDPAAVEKAAKLLLEKTRRAELQAKLDAAKNASATKNANPAAPTRAQTPSSTTATTPAPIIPVSPPPAPPPVANNPPEPHHAAVVAISTPQPTYPEQAMRAGISGEVTVAFTVNADGDVSKVRIVSAKPRGVFDRSVLNAVAHWKFQPPEESQEVTRAIHFKP